MSIFDSIESAVQSRQPVYPPEQSGHGNNTYTVKGCAAIGYTPGYCVCLCKIKAFERDGALAHHTECEKAISGRTCRALAMRQEEQAAGKALFYVDRGLLREEMDKAFAAPVARFAPSKPTSTARHKFGTLVATKPGAEYEESGESVRQVVKPAKPAVEPSFMPEDGYAAAINAAIKEAAQPAPAPIPKPKVVSPSPSPVSKGLSMIEKARLQMGLNKE